MGEKSWGKISQGMDPSNLADGGTSTSLDAFHYNKKAMHECIEESKKVQSARVVRGGSMDRHSDARVEPCIHTLPRCRLNV